MAKGQMSPNRRRQLRHGRGRQVWGDGRRRHDWIVGGTSCDNSGAPGTTASWGGSITLASGQAVTLQLGSIPIAPAAPTSAPPPVGEMEIQAVSGSLFFTNLNPTPAVYTFGIGIYIAKYNVVSGKWDIRQPQQTAEACRDDYEFLRVVQVTLPGLVSTIPATQTFPPIMVEVPVGLTNPVILGGGEALHLSVDCLGATINTVGTQSGYMTPFVRALVRSIA